MQKFTQLIKNFVNKSKMHRVLSIAVVLVAVIGAGLTINHLAFSSKNSNQVTNSKNIAKVKQQSKKNKQIHPQKTVDWTKPSETKPYPEVRTAEDVTLDVNLKKQRVYVKDANKKVLYTMYASSGMKNTTPKGHFEMEEERGTDFYNPKEKMGANYYSSFHDHGTYLFHTVPTDVNGEYIKKEADLLGKRPSSHGCVRLSIPDAKWIFEKIPRGTKVYVH